MDVYYRGFRLRVELDGRLTHSDELRWLDMARDNAALVDGDVTMRFGWAGATEGACAAAEQVATVLAAQGWTGTLRRCGRGCLLSAAVS